MRYYWFSTHFATGLVETNEHGIITESAPMWKRWKGMLLESMTNYYRARSKEPVIVKELADEKA